LETLNNNIPIQEESNILIIEDAVKEQEGDNKDSVLFGEMDNTEFTHSLDNH